MVQLNYKDAGVDQAKGDLFVEKIKKMVGRTYNSSVESGVGGFASLYKIEEDRFIVGGTDGVGTKLILAQILNLHHTIGIDLVAMCVNDIICTGARPLFFLDYLAQGKLDIERSEAIISGIIEGCVQGKMALVGGETAEMPGLYSDIEYDLAGFAVGEVFRENLLDGRNITEGDTLIGIASSGFHSNGFSLIRKLVQPHEIDLQKELLTPTRIYAELVQKLFQKFNKNQIKALAHITGGGLENIPRVNPDFDYVIMNMPDRNELPQSMQTIIDRADLSKNELYTTFNCGVGMVLICNNPKEVSQFLADQNEKYWLLGQVKKGQGELVLMD